MQDLAGMRIAGTSDHLGQNDVTARVWEIAALVAESEAAARITHGRYFLGFTELANRHRLSGGGAQPAPAGGIAAVAASSAPSSGSSGMAMTT
jgi:hypothetical protein